MITFKIPTHPSHSYVSITKEYSGTIFYRSNHIMYAIAGPHIGTRSSRALRTYIRTPNTLLYRHDGLDALGGVNNILQGSNTWVSAPCMQTTKHLNPETLVSFLRFCNVLRHSKLLRMSNY